MPRLLLAGRYFRIASKRTSLRHDLATEAQIMRAGLNTLEIYPDEAPEDFVARVSAEALQDKEKLTLLGHVLLPEEISEKEWTPAAAADVAEYLASFALRGAARADLQNQMAAMLEGLISTGATRLVQTSPAAFVM